MSTKHRSTPFITIFGIALMLGAPTGAALADEIRGYVIGDSMGYVTDGSGDCVITPYWSPQRPAQACHPAMVQKEEPKRTDVAALEEATPVTAAPEKIIKEIRLDATMLFDFDAATLRPEGKEQLSGLITQLNSFNDVSSIVIEGHTDRIGPEEYNETLSRQRAESVRTYLSANSPLSDSTIRVLGLGESQPLQSCDGVRGDAAIQCLQPNRRVEVKVMGLEETAAQ